MILLKGLFICEDLQKIILKRGIMRGYVHSVFKNACNIECDDLFITLLNSSSKMSPMTVLVEGLENIGFNGLGITQGLTFQFSENKIYCAGVNLFITMDNIKKWSSTVEINTSNSSEQQILERIVIIEQGLKIYGNHYGVWPLVNMLSGSLPQLELFSFYQVAFDKSAEFIGDRFLNYIKAVISADVIIIADRAQRIIGFGRGLTPAMDDFISGLMISYIYMGSYYKLNLTQIYEFNSKMISLGIHKTTRVSSEMLKHSALGEVNEAVQNLMKAILSFHGDIDYDNHKEIIKSLIEVIEYGETSGTDTTFGIYVGLKILTNLNNRRVWLNEPLCEH